MSSIRPLIPLLLAAGILLGGNVSVVSRPGQGSIFTVNIPTHLRERFPDLPAKPTPQDVFLRLRELRNAW